jgi:hypothetical protein
MQERRSIKRTQMHRPAKIWAGQPATLDCVVHDLTNCGAGLEVPASVRLPPYFTLFFESVRFGRTCEVKWRTPGRIGVAFTSPRKFKGELARTIWAALSMFSLWPVVVWRSWV